MPRKRQHTRLPQKTVSLPIWPYGRVFETSSGLHGEFFTPDQMILSLLYLGHDDVTAIRTMKNVTQQTMYIVSLKDLY